MRKAFLSFVLLAISVFCMASTVFAGNIILTGHDDDYHVTIDNSTQAKNQLAAIVAFVRSGAPDPTKPVLTFDHGTKLQAALTTLGIPFTNVDPNTGTPSAALFDTTIYSAIIVASDQSCGGCDNDTTSSTNLANAAASFASFFNAGGGIVGLSGASNANYYKFVPAAASQFGSPPSSPYVQTAFGASIGVPACNGNPTHNFFSEPGTGGVDPAFQVAERFSGTTGGVTDPAETLGIKGGTITNGAFSSEPLLLVNYFAGARGSRPDQTVRITNPGTDTEDTAGLPTAGSGGPETADLCANIYVFSPDQQLAECCSCFVSPNGLRTLSADFDLANNPLTPTVLGEGVIKIVASEEFEPTATPGTAVTSKGACLQANGAGAGRSTAASGYVPVAALRAWGTHNQDVSSPGSLSGAGVINWVTETHFLGATLSNAELKSLQSNCDFIQRQGSGAGKCTCGRGD